MRPSAILSELYTKVSFNLRHHARQPHPLRSLAADLLARSGGTRIVTFRHAGSRFRLRPAGLSRLLWAEPKRALDGERFVSRFLRLGETMVDVGANIGVHALAASRVVGGRGRVLAIEAHPETFRALEDNIRLNGTQNLTAVCSAAGPSPGRVRFSNRPDDDWNQVDAAGSLEVEQRTLDEIGSELGAVALMKIDVEGYELPCLRGASALLARTQCVMLEYWTEHTRHFGYRLVDLVEFMRGCDFSAHVLVEEGAGVAAPPLPIAAEPGELLNLVFVRDLAALQRIVPAPLAPFKT